jgi:hypothetical protein
MGTDRQQHTDDHSGFQQQQTTKLHQRAEVGGIRHGSPHG